MMERIAKFWFLLAALGVPRAANAEVAWRVVSGDTLTSIARQHGVSVADLRRWNGLDSDQVYVGQQLKVDGPQEALQEPPERSTPEETATDDGAPALDGTTHVVQAGETLTEIAVALSVSIADLQALNPGLEPDHIREGQVLRIVDRGRKVRYQIQPGENLTMIAARYETSVEAIVEENPGITADFVRSGEYLTIYTKIPDSRSESLGSPNRGRLVDGIRLTAHPAYVIRDNERAWGTVETVYGIRRAFDAVMRSHPESPKVEIHDLSLREGGFLQQHRSHQSGRDADIAYYSERCVEKGLCDFSKVRPSQLDSKRQWALIRPWLEAGAVESIFVDYALQRVLYREAKRNGASKEELSLWFQYPRGRSHPLGIIRHCPAHRDHLHVRFICHDTDEECRTFRPILMRVQQQAHASNDN